MTCQSAKGRDTLEMLTKIDNYLLPRRAGTRGAEGAYAPLALWSGGAGGAYYALFLGIRKVGGKGKMRKIEEKNKTNKKGKRGKFEEKKLKGKGAYFAFLVRDEDKRGEKKKRNLGEKV